MKKGVGQTFLQECLGGDTLKDYRCKAKVLLECIHETPESISITLTMLSAIFVPVPKRCVVDYSADEGGGDPSL